MLVSHALTHVAYIIRTTHLHIIGRLSVEGNTMLSLGVCTGNKRRRCEIIIHLISFFYIKTKLFKITKSFN